MWGALRVGQERDLNSDDDFGDTNEVVYYHQNSLFTVYALSDGNESVIERYRYDAYGACTVLDADACPPAVWRGSDDADGLSEACPERSRGIENPHLFTGRRLDGESGALVTLARARAVTAFARDGGIRGWIHTLVSPLGRS